MMKILVLPQWYSLSDPELKRQANDRISFRRFLGLPDVISEATTVWLFREHLAETGGDRLVWGELQRQLNERGLKVRKGVVQDASRSSPLIRVTRRKISHVERRHGPGGAGTALGPRRRQTLLCVQAARQDGC